MLKTLRKCGACKGDPSTRQALALRLENNGVTPEQVSRLARAAAVETEPENAGRLLTDWLKGGDYRGVLERLDREKETEPERTPDKVDPERFEAMCGCAVLADQRTPEQAAQLIGCSIDQVVTAVISYADRRGHPAHLVQQRLGLSKPARTSIPRTGQKMQTVDEALQHSATKKQIQELCDRLGRQPTSSMLLALFPPARNRPDSPSDCD